MSVLMGERLGEGLTASVPCVPIQGLFYVLSAYDTKLLDASSSLSTMVGV